MKLNDLPLEIIFRVVHYLDIRSFGKISSCRRLLSQFSRCRMIMVESLFKKMTNKILYFILKLSKDTKILVRSKPCWVHVRVYFKEEPYSSNAIYITINGLTGYITCPEIPYYARSKYFDHVDKYVNKSFLSAFDDAERLSPYVSDNSLSRLWCQLSKRERLKILEKVRASPI